MTIALTQACQTGWIYTSALLMSTYPKLPLKITIPGCGSIRMLFIYFNQRTKLRKIAKESGQQTDIENYNSKRKEAKLILNNNYSDYSNDIKLSSKDNPKTFCSFVKATTKSSLYPFLLKCANNFSSCSVDKANMFNNFFQSVFFTK